MIAGLVSDLGPWTWMVLGVLLLCLEIVLPGVYLLWIGIAALATGLVSLQLWETGWWTWHVQVLVFLALSLVAAYLGKRISTSRETSDQPLLNRRSAQLIGRTATLAEPIREGRGRIRIGDTLWRVEGPDLPSGARVRVVGVSAAELELIVEPA